MAIKIRKLREMPNQELNAKLTELYLELSKERSSSEIGTVKNPGRIKDIRISVARILTIKNERVKRGD